MDAYVQHVLYVLASIVVTSTALITICGVVPMKHRAARRIRSIMMWAGSELAWGTELNMLTLGLGGVLIVITMTAYAFGVFPIARFDLLILMCFVWIMGLARIIHTQQEQ